MAEPMTVARIELPRSYAVRLRVMAAAAGRTIRGLLVEMIDRHDRDHFGGRAAGLVGAATAGESAGGPHPGDGKGEEPHTRE